MKNAGGVTEGVALRYFFEMFSVSAVILQEIGRAYPKSQESQAREGQEGQLTNLQRRVALRLNVWNDSAIPRNTFQSRLADFVEQYA